MPASVRQLFLALPVLLLGPRVAAAHSSLESTGCVWVRPTGIDVQLFMSRASASVLIEKNGELVTLMRDNFPAYESRLAAVGPTLLSLTAGAGAALQAESSAAAITDEDDICFRLHYPLPRAMPGTLAIHGNYLHQMEEGHVVSIYALNAINDQLGQGEISVESPDLAVHLPAAAALSSPPSADTADLPAAADTAPAAPPARSSHWGLWAALGGGALVIALVVLRGGARPGGGRSTRA